MRYFSCETNGEDGPIEEFFMPQTPQEFANRVARSLTSPNFLDGKYVFSLVVWGLPEGCGTLTMFLVLLRREVRTSSVVGRRRR